MSPRHLIGGSLVLLGLVLLAYAPTFNAGFIWDDPAYVIENETLRSLDGLRRMWFEPRSIPQYYPLVHTTFWVEYQLWGLEPAGFHVVNVLVHFVAALLVWLILLQLFPRRVPGPDDHLLALGATWVAAAVFALHPVHVESVAWITERKNVLSAVFYLASMLVLLPTFRITHGTERAFRWSRYAAGFALFLAALLSKSVTFSLPAALLLLVYWKRARIGAREFALAAPMIAAGAVAGLHTAWLEKVEVGAQFIDWGLSFADRILIAGRVVVFYAGKLLWPYPLLFNYPRWEIDTGQLWQWAFPVAVVTTLGILFWKRDRIGRGPLVAVLFFVGSLFPALGFIDVYPMLFSWVADHFQYLPSLGIIVLVVLGAAWLSDHKRSKPWIGQAIAAIVLVALTSLTFVQCLIYWDEETLWRETLEANPDSWLALDNLAALLMKRETASADPAQSARLAGEASRLLERSLELNQDSVAYRSLAQMRLQEGRFEEAVHLFHESLELTDDATARLNLSVALGQLGREAEQQEELERSLELVPHLVPALRNLAVSRLQARDPELQDPLSARALAHRACELTQRNDPLQLIVLAEAEAGLGRHTAALEAVDEALALARGSGLGGQIGSLEAKRAEYAAGLAAQEGALTDPSADFWNTPAPPRFRVRVETSEGPFVVEVERRLAPIGVDRFFNLVRAGYFDNSRFFRVRESYIAQFGIAGEPSVAQVWRHQTIADDPVEESNLRGTFAYAMTGPDTRTTQIYINLTDNAHLDEQGFAPLGRVVEGMEVVDKLYAGYGEETGGGMRRGRQDRMFAEGNAHLDVDYPELSRLIRATIE